MFELMIFEPIVVRWRSRGARHDWHSYVVLPFPSLRSLPLLSKRVEFSTLDAGFSLIETEEDMLP